MAEELVRVTTEAGVATITLNRPDKLNALNQGVADGLLAAVAAIAADPSARAVVLRGEGRSFCVGADLHAVASDTPSARRAWVNRVTELHLALRRLGKPTVARVHGHALGAGCSLMMACDLALAADDAVMGYPEVEHGLVPGVSMIFLQQAVGAPSKGGRPADPARKRLLDNRQVMENQWAGKISALEASGQHALAFEARRFVDSLPPVRTEAEWLVADTARERGREQMEKIPVDRSPIALTR